MWQRAMHSSSISDLTERSKKFSLTTEVVAITRLLSDDYLAGPHIAQMVHHSRIASETDRSVRCAQISPKTSLRRLIGLHGRVPIKMIGSKVQPC